LKKFVLTSALVSSFSLSSPALAQSGDSTDQGNEAARQEAAIIVVTANRRSENIQDVPITISAVSADDLANSNVTSLQELTTLVSGYVGPGETGTLSPHLRGVGSQIASPGIEASVATYVDDVYIGARSPALLNLHSVERLEVLKGPQGTLFGRNTTGGLINITSRSPDNELAADLELGYANFETLTGSVYINVPMSDDIRANLAVSGKTMGDGWGTNLATGSPTSKINEQWSVRSIWDFSLGSDTSLRLIGDYEYHDDTNFFLGRFREGILAVDGTIVTPGAPPAGPGLPPTPPVPGTYRVPDLGWDANTYRDVLSNSEAYGLTARLTHDFDFATLTNILAYRDTDYDLLGFTGNNSPNAAANDVEVFWRTKNTQLTNELRLSSNDRGPLTWTVGVYYFDAKDTSDQDVPGGPLGPPFTTVYAIEKDTTSYAAFGQASYEVSTGTTVTAGLRYSREEVSIGGTVLHFPAVPFAFLDKFPDQSFSQGSVSARVSIAHEFNKDTMIYASYNRGSKSGTYNIVGPSEPPTEDETLDAFEVGARLDLLDGILRFNFAGFYYAYDNIQLNSFFFAGPPSQFNGPKSTLYGLDVDLVFRPTSALTISANAELMHTKFGSYPDAEIFRQIETITPGVPGAQVFIGDATGFDLPLAPEFTANIAVNYEIPTQSSGTFNLNATYSYNSGFFGSPGNEALNRESSYGRLGASIKYADPSDRYFVRIWGANLTNTQSTVQLNYTAAGPAGSLDAPRTYGITLGAKFP